MSIFKGFISELLKTAAPAWSAAGRNAASQQAASNIQSFAAKGSPPASPVTSTPGQLSGTANKGMQSREADLGQMASAGKLETPPAGKEIKPSGLNPAKQMDSPIASPAKQTAGPLANPKPIAAGSVGQNAGSLDRKPALNKQRFNPTGKQTAENVGIPSALGADDF